MLQNARLLGDSEDYGVYALGSNNAFFFVYEYPIREH
jgi:hypothetical protein